ncbi:hypothetical protein CsatB_003638 [Cannabis sativa]
MRCLNVNFHTLGTIRVHLFLSGIQPSYNPWYFHWETFSQPAVELHENDEEEMADVLADMLRGDPGFDKSANTTDSFNEPPINDNNKFDDLFKEMESELYPGCKKSALNALVKLMHCKVLNRWSNHSFDMLLSILIELFPEGTKLPKSHYGSKMRLCNLGLGYDSIDVCKYNCAIFWKENEKKEFCPLCGKSRWVKKKGKEKKVPHKVMRYFQLTPRLKRLYCSRHTAKDMRWHYSQRPKEDGVLRHPADAEEWKRFDRLHPYFAVEPRNVRLGLATDGFHPFGNMSNSYSLWPVICVPYNLPPWKCPSSPGKDIDVFMRPLIDELKEFWETGVEARDAYNGTVFSMRAAVFWTINYFPAYALMSGWSTKGYMVCPTCNEHTPSIGLNSKIGYVGHRRFLKMSDPRRRSKKYNGKPKKRAPPPVLTGDDILSQLDRIPLSLPGKHKQFGGVKRKHSSAELNWSKKSTLLSIDGMSKDTDKARMDLQDLQIRHFIKSVRFPDSFVANLDKNVNLDTGKISGLKSHDCHVLLQRLLSACICKFLKKEIRDTIIELCVYFKQLCSRTLNVSDLEKMQTNILTILCKLETIFPPAFFDIMVHVVMHLFKEAMLPPDRVTQEVWSDCIAYWSTDKQKANPDIGELSTAVETFQNFHHKGNNWRNEYAQQAYEQIVELAATQPAPTEDQPDEPAVNPTQYPRDLPVMTQVLGERSRHLRGFGHLPRLKGVGAKRAPATHSSAPPTVTMEQYEVLQKKVEEAEQTTQYTRQ